jgi:arylsulfatase
MWFLLAACGNAPRDAADRDPSGTGDDPPSGDTAADAPPNLLLVVIDDVGVDRFAPYGNADARAPHLDALAARGRVFRNAWAYASCSPSRAALYTGRHARRTGYGSNVEPPEVYRLDPAQTTIAEVLRAAPVPYATAFLGKWHLETARTDWGGPRSQGWDEYAGSQSNLVGDYFHWQIGRAHV